MKTGIRISASPSPPPTSLQLQVINVNHEHVCEVTFENTTPGLMDGLSLNLNPPTCPVSTVQAGGGV